MPGNHFDRHGCGSGGAFGERAQVVLGFDGHHFGNGGRVMGKFMPLPAPTSITRPAKPASARSRCSAVPRRSDSALILSYIRANRGCWKADRSVMVGLRFVEYSLVGIGVEEFLVDYDGRERALGRALA